MSTKQPRRRFALATLCALGLSSPLASAAPAPSGAAEGATSSSPTEPAAASTPAPEAAAQAKAATTAQAPATKPSEAVAAPDPLASAIAEPVAPVEPVYLAPKQARFQVISVHLSAPLDGRRLSPERLITLAVKGDGQIMESFWERKRLSLYREVIIPSPVEGVPAGVRQEQVGFARVQSVMGNVLQAQVEIDGLTQRSAEPSDAMIVMIGDSGKLFVEPEAAPKPKRKRRPKPKPKSPFVREEMKWRL